MYTKGCCGNVMAYASEWGHTHLNTLPVQYRHQVSVPLHDLMVRVAIKQRHPHLWDHKNVVFLSVLSLWHIHMCTSTPLRIHTGSRKAFFKTLRTHWHCLLTNGMDGCQRTCLPALFSHFYMQQYLLHQHTPACTTKGTRTHTHTQHENRKLKHAVKDTQTYFTCKCTHKQNVSKHTAVAGYKARCHLLTHAVCAHIVFTHSTHTAQCIDTDRRIFGEQEPECFQRERC